MDGIAVEQPKDDGVLKVLFYLKAVPSIFEADSFIANKIFGEWFATEVFQLKAAHEIDANAHENLIQFKYEVSPFAVRYSNAKENIFQFLINICAIIGGIFTVAGIIDSLIHKTSKIVFKDSINKLQ